MRACVQRVTCARVEVDSQIVGEIGPGLVVLLAVGKDDTEADATFTAQKIASLRIFPDQQGKMNCSVVEEKGGVLAISQFTLFGDVRKGRRPSFGAAADPETGNRLYEYFIRELKAMPLNVESGRFQTDMQVHLVNDGPVTILVDSKKDF